MCHCLSNATQFRDIDYVTIKKYDLIESGIKSQTSGISNVSQKYVPKLDMGRSFLYFLKSYFVRRKILRFPGISFESKRSQEDLYIRNSWYSALVRRKIARFEKIAHGWERRIEESGTFLRGGKKKERSEECKEKESGRKHGWWRPRAVQIFVGAEKQSGIRSPRYGTATRSGDARGRGARV